MGSFPTTTCCLLVGLLALALSGCAETSNPDSDSKGEVTEYTANGRIVRILENSRLIQVAHGDIYGFMPAMPMPFEFRSDAIRIGVSEGDSILFRIASDGIDNWIVDLTVVE